jgi:hypothetical protein
VKSQRAYVEHVIACIGRIFEDVAPGREAVFSSRTLQAIPTAVVEKGRDGIAMWQTVLIDVPEIQVDAINQFLLAGNADAPQHAARHFAEHGLHDVQPGAVSGCEDELESVRMKAEPALGFFGSVRRVVVEQEANPGLGRIALVEATLRS